MDNDEKRYHRERHADLVREILLAWVQQRPASTSGANVVEGFKDAAIKSAAAICEICARIAEDPEVTARRDAAERKAADKKAEKKAKEVAEQDQKDAEARAQLAKQRS